MLGVIDAPYTAVDKHFAALHAGMGGAVQFGSADIYAVHGRLDDNVLFCVQPPADFMPLSRWNAHLFAQAAYLKTVGNSRGRTVIAGGENAFVLHCHSPHPAARAGGAPTDKVGDVHEVLGPGQSLHGISVKFFASVHRGSVKAKPTVRLFGIKAVSPEPGSRFFRYPAGCAGARFSEASLRNGGPEAETSGPR